MRAPPLPKIYVVPAAEEKEMEEEAETLDIWELIWATSKEGWVWFIVSRFVVACVF